MNKIAIFGSSGALGQALFERLTLRHDVVSFSRQELHFDRGTTDLDAHLDTHFDLIFNCVGRFDDNSREWSNLFDANYGSCWLIIKHYIVHPPKYPVTLVFMGSTSSNGPRRNYMNYAASKAALFSLVNSAQEYFEGSLVTVKLEKLSKFQFSFYNTIEFNGVCLSETC